MGEFTEWLEEQEKWSKDVEIEKGKMHKTLGLKPDEDITKKYTSGKKLAQDLVNKVGKKEAAGMINFAANVNPKQNIFDDAQKALKEL